MSLLHSLWIQRHFEQIKHAQPRERLSHWESNSSEFDLTGVRVR